MQVSIYSTRPNTNRNEYYLLEIHPVDESALLKSDDDYRKILSVVAECCGQHNEVLPIMYCIQSECVKIGVLSSYKDADEYLTRLLHGYDGWGGSPNKKLSAIKDTDLLKVSADIHTAISDWMDYEFSSVRAYLYDDKPEWLYTGPLAEARGSASKYLRYLQNIAAS